LRIYSWGLYTSIRRRLARSFPSLSA